MGIERLDHVNVVTTRLTEMVEWYEAVLGLTAGPRPDFPFQGAWLYAGDQPVVHLVGATSEAGVGSEATLKLEHFAFTATDPAGFEARLQQHAHPFRQNIGPIDGLVQFHLADPDGNHVHIDFNVTATP